MPKRIIDEEAGGDVALAVEHLELREFLFNAPILVIEELFTLIATAYQQRARSQTSPATRRLPVGAPYQKYKRSPSFP